MWAFVSDPQTVVPLAAQYMERLTQIDLIARGCKDVADYAMRFKNSIVPRLTNAQRQKLDDAVAIASKALKPFRARSIPLKIALLERDPEDGYPHTHGDLIMLTTRSLWNTTENLAKTIVHELVHVFQRLFPVETHILLLQRHGLKVVLGINDELVRANPDKGSLSYGIGPVTCHQKFRSRSPANLADSYISCSMASPDPVLSMYEHPNEAMAYMVADIVMRQRVSESQRDSYAIVKQWMVEYF